MNIAIVTGASSGLGREFVRLLDARQEYDEIWVIARRTERLLEIAKRTKTTVIAVPLDLSEKEAIRSLAEHLKKEKPNVRMLINAAGYGRIGSYQDVSVEDCEGMIDLNCRAAVAVTQTVLPFMKRGAHIMQICSTAAFQPFPYLNVYAASKAFLYRYSRALRVELKPRKISVTAVCPYWIKDTEFIGRASAGNKSSAIRSFPLASKQKTVARRAMRDTRLGFAVSTPGVVCKAHRAAAKVVPGSVMMGLWAAIRRL